MVVFFKGWIYAFASGLFGATFFMLVDLQRSLSLSRSSELRDLWTFRMIALRCAVGIGAATILYFFFQTRLLGEGVWPSIGGMSFESESAVMIWPLLGQVQFRLPNKDLALLVVWSFLAGYSQNLVPSILTRTAQSSDVSAE